MGVSPDDFNLLVGLLCYDMPVYARELTLPLAERRLSVFLSFNDFAAGVNVCLAVREFLYRAEQLFRAELRDVLALHLDVCAYVVVDMPGAMMCERCLPTEQAIATGRHDADLSADEQ